MEGHKRLSRLFSGDGYVRFSKLIFLVIIEFREVNLMRFFSVQNLDVGDDLRVPDELPEQEKAGLRLVNTLISGGAAGAVSRTCTAPIDRLKVLLQVSFILVIGEKRMLDI